MDQTRFLQRVRMNQFKGGYDLDTLFTTSSPKCAVLTRKELSAYSQRKKCLKPLGKA